ncbi:MAG: thioredoxin family protein [Thaumarchaeota archaeon]|nr:thioredoxin family protein [Nitrososphaerota archaeon]
MALFDDQARKEVTAFFAERLKGSGSAKIFAFLPKDVSECEYCAEIEELSSELETLSKGKIKTKRLIIEDARELADRLKVKRAPATVVTDDGHNFALKFYGLPSGYEFSALLSDIEDISNGLTIFSSCNFSLAMVDAEMIEASEFPELAEKYSVMAVPKIVINDSLEFEGALPEQTFVSKVEEAISAS